MYIILASVNTRSVDFHKVMIMVFNGTFNIISVIS